MWVFTSVLFCSITDLFSEFIFHTFACWGETTLCPSSCHVISFNFSHTNRLSRALFLQCPAVRGRVITWCCVSCRLFPVRASTGCCRRDARSSGDSSPSSAPRPSWTLTCSNSTSLRCRHVSPRMLIPSHAHYTYIRPFFILIYMYIIYFPSNPLKINK